MVKLLLNREEVNPDKPDFCDQTPLSYAAEGRNEGGETSTRTGRGQYRQANHDRQTPLCFATMYGHNTVAPLLQAHKAITAARHKASEESPRGKSHPSPSESATYAART